MADNSVFITGIADGTLQESLEKMPHWATEKTAMQIEKWLRKSYDTQNKSLAALVKNATGGSSGGPGNQKNINSELAIYLKLLKDANNEGKVAKKRKKAQQDEDDKALIFGKKLRTGTEKFSYTITLLAAMGQKVLDVDKQYLKTHDAMFQSGVNVMNGNNDAVDGFTSLNQAVILTGLRLETLQKVSEKYSSSINAIGFSKFAKTVNKSNKDMQDLGYSTAQTAEMVGAYTDMQSNYNDMRGKSEKQLAAEVTAFGKKVKDTSLLMGISQEKAVSNAKALSESVDMSVVSATLGADAAKNVANALMGVDPSMGAKFASLVADSSIGLGQLNSSVMDMVKSGSHYQVEMQQMGKDLATMSQKEFTAKWGALVQDKKYSEEMTRLQLMKHTSVGAEATNTLQIMAVMRNTVNRTSLASEEQGDKVTETAASSARLTSELEKLSATLQASFNPLVSQVNALAASLGVVNSASYGAIDSVNSTIRSWIGAVALGAGAIGMFALRVNGINTVLSLFGKKGFSLPGMGGGAGGGAGAGAGGAGAGGAGGGTAGRIMSALKVLRVAGVGITAATYSGNAGEANESEQVAARFKKPPTVTNSKIQSPQASDDTPAPVSVPVTNPQPTSGSGKVKEPKGSDISNLLNAQISALNQILITNNNLLSTSQDILRFTRMHA